MNRPLVALTYVNAKSFLQMLNLQQFQEGCSWEGELSQTARQLYANLDPVPLVKFSASGQGCAKLSQIRCQFQKEHFGQSYLQTFSNAPFSAFLWNSCNCMQFQALLNSVQLRAIDSGKAFKLITTLHWYPLWNLAVGLGNWALWRSFGGFIGAVCFCRESSTQKSKASFMELKCELFEAHPLRESPPLSSNECFLKRGVFFPSGGGYVCPGTSSPVGAD